MHTDFLQMITGKIAKQSGDGTFEMPGAEGIREALGTQLVRVYIEMRQATVAQWVALSSLFEVCARETGYERGGRRSKVWGGQEATEKKLWATLENSREAKRRRSSGGEMGMQ